MSWKPGEAFSPTYPDLPVIEVVDTIRATLRPLRRRKWTRARNAALAMWEASGLRFNVREGDHLGWIRCYPGSITMSFEDLTGWGANGSTPSGWGQYTPEFGCGAALFHPPTVPADDEWTAGLIAHEVGHCLGFSHGGCGVMAMGYFPCSSRQVSDEELDAARRYYFNA